MNKRPTIILAASLLLLTIFACALPGQQTASTPAPTVDPAQLDLMVAETVSAVLQQTAQAPLPTQAATLTLPQPTTDVEVTARPVLQSSITVQADGNSFFVDGKAGFNLLVPPGWLPVRIDQLEYYDAFSLPEAADPAVQAALMDINDLDPNVFRLFIFDVQAGHVQGGFVNNVNTIWSTDQSISLETDTEIKKTAQALPASVPGLVVTSSSVSSTASGIPIGVILSDISGQTTDGTPQDLFQKQVFLNAKQGVLIITFTSQAAMKDATLPFFDAIIDSLKID